jgi:uncharacterized protein (DUF1810 family)
VPEKEYSRCNEGQMHLQYAFDTLNHARHSEVLPHSDLGKRFHQNTDVIFGIEHIARVQFPGDEVERRTESSIDS